MALRDVYWSTSIGSWPSVSWIMNVLQTVKSIEKTVNFPLLLRSISAFPSHSITADQVNILHPFTSNHGAAVLSLCESLLRRTNIHADPAAVGVLCDGEQPAGESATSSGTQGCRSVSSTRFIYYGIRG
ncbi:hypothetical protein B0H11DRAFT_1916939 [Mycena galericulata]|nr:hypothetical protein B0H11DRAFT_1916939 [Mycena galericulata]